MSRSKAILVATLAVLVPGMFCGLAPATAQTAPAPQPADEVPVDDDDIVVDDDGSVVAPEPPEVLGDVVPGDDEVPGDGEVPGDDVVPGDETRPEAPATTEEPAPVEATTEPLVVPVPAQEPPDASVDRAAQPGLREALESMAATMRVSGYLQADYARHDISLDELSDGTRAPLNEDRFQIRRARLRLENDWRYVGFAGETEFFADGNSARPVAFDVHAHLDAQEGRRPLLEFKVGLFPIPFTYQNPNQPAYDNFFAERALMTDGFVPGRFDLGVAVSGHLWAVDWILAAQNGQPLGADDFSYQDPNRAKDYAGRVQVTGALLAGVHASAGVSFLAGTGFSAGTAPTKDTFEWRDLNEDGRVIQSELIPIPGSAGRASQNFDRWGLGGDVRVWKDIPRLGELRLDAELALANNLDRGVAPADPILLGRDQRGLGYYASLTQELTEHWQAGLRYDQYQPNIDELELLEGRSLVTRRKFRTYTGGVSARLELSDYARARVHLEYSHQRNSLGRDNQGKPANLDNDVMLVRSEVVF